MALIPPSFLNTTVALGGPSQDGTIQYTATGFIYGHPTGITDDSGNKRYSLFLVTNQHVLEGAARRNTTFHARFNRPMGSEASIYEIGLKDGNGSSLWTVHPDKDADVAVTRINYDKLHADGIEFSWFPGDEAALTLCQARASEISEGDGIFVLGFPLGQAGDERNYTIVRQGILARVQDWLKGDARSFLIDASIFPGNSGGPVLLKPELASIRGTQSHDRCVLIGMVSSYLPYRETAVSLQTERPRMTFEENSGLGVVMPHDVIQETIEAAVDKLRTVEQVGPDPRG